MSNALSIPQTTAAQWRQQRFNPLRTVTPATLGAYIDQYDAGYLRSFALAAREIMERDDTLCAVVPKRKRRVARRRWDVIIGEDVPEEQQAQAETHQQALKYFYSSLRVRNAVETDEQGGLKLLVRRMMEAQFLRYSAAEIQWHPSSQGMRATLHYVPQEFFETTAGELRFAGVSGTTPGQVMPKENWLIAVADGCIMKAAAVCYMFKRLSLADWLNLSGKFGIPAIHGETTATKGSPEWNEFVSMLERFANDWIGATSVGSKINILSAAASGESPFAPMVDRMDRAMARLALGSDLSTLSRDDGAGASLQGAEVDELICDDCEWISELFNEQLSRRVIEWQFGPGTEPLAFFQLVGPQRQDTKLEMEVDNHVTKHGVRLSVDDVAERFSRTHVDQAEAPDLDPDPEEAANERGVVAALQNKRSVLFEQLLKGVQSDLKPAVTALLTLENARTPEDLRAAALALDLPAIERQVMQGSAANDAMEVVLAAEFLAGLAHVRDVSPAANVFNPLQPRDLRGRFSNYGTGGGGSGKKKKAEKKNSIQEVVQGAIADPDNTDWVDYAEVDASTAASIAQRTQDPRDVSGYKRVLISDAVQHAMQRHANDPRPITEADFEQLPDMLANPTLQVWEADPKGDRLKSIIIGPTGQITIIEEQRTGRKKLAFVTMYRK